MSRRRLKQNVVRQLAIGERGPVVVLYTVRNSLQHVPARWAMKCYDKMCNVESILFCPLLRYPCSSNCPHCVRSLAHPLYFMNKIIEVNQFFLAVTVSLHSHRQLHHSVPQLAVDRSWVRMIIATNPASQLLNEPTETLQCLLPAYSNIPVCGRLPGMILTTGML